MSIFIDEIISEVEKITNSLLSNEGSLLSTTEWNICHHLACELKDCFPDYEVDVELEKIDLRRPDIVIHKRGNNSDNLVVFQVKKHPSLVEIKEDILKIKETFFREPYSYKYGIFVSIGSLPSGYDSTQLSTGNLRVVEVKVS